MSASATPVPLRVRAAPDHPVHAAVAAMPELFRPVTDGPARAAVVADSGAEVGALLESGVAVLQQPPVAASDYAVHLRAARRARIGYRLLDLGVASDEVLGALTRAVGERVTAIEASVNGVAALDAVARLVSALAGPATPRPLPVSGPLTRAGVAGVEVTLTRGDGDLAALVPEVVTVRGARGTAVLTGRTDLDGGSRPGLADHVPLDPVDALLARELRRWHAELAAGRGAAGRAAAQADLSACRAVEAALVLPDGSAPPPSAAPGPEPSSDSVDADTVHADALRAAGRLDTNRAAAALDALDRAALAAMAEQLDIAFRGGPADAARIASTVGVAPRHAWILRRWLAALMDEGMLRRGPDGFEPTGFWPVGRFPRVGDEELIGHYASLGFGTEVGRLHTTVREHLAGLLTDRVELRTLLFGRGGHDVADELYGRAWLSRYLNAAAAGALGTRLDGLPGGPRVLELGAGVGASTEVVCAELGDAAQYTFSDVSRHFLTEARRRFDERGLRHPRYCLLDIDHDLVRQGAPVGCADAVVAAHVLHNARDLSATLRSIRGVMRRGGTIALIESTRETPPLLVSMLFLMSAAPGTPPAGSGDARAGTDTIFLSVEAWRRELGCNGFQVDHVLAPDHHGELPDLGQCLIVATATATRNRTTA